MVILERLEKTYKILLSYDYHIESIVNDLKSMHQIQQLILFKINANQQNEAKKQKKRFIHTSDYKIRKSIFNLYSNSSNEMNSTDTDFLFERMSETCTNCYLFNDNVLECT